MQNRIILFVITALTIAACGTKDNCFQDLASLDAKPIAIDTLVLFDPKTFAESCFETRFYMPTDTPVDSTYNIDEKEIQLAKTATCYQLLSIKQQITNCN